MAKADAECYVVDRALFHEVLQRKTSLAGEIGKLLAERQTALEGEREGLTAEAARMKAQNDLLGRIKNFFGLS